MLLGVRGRTPSLAHHNVLFAESLYDAEFDSVFGRPGSLGGQQRCANDQGDEESLQEAAYSSHRGWHRRRLDQGHESLPCC